MIGAGSVATDTARTLKRLGVADVICACIEDEANIPAASDELCEAREEGIKFMTSVSPCRMISDFSALQGVAFKKVDSCSRDENGRFIIHCKEDSEFVIDCDTLIFATGQRADIKQIAENAGLALLPNGRFQYDEKTNMTSREGVFVAGGVMEARGSVVSAMASGRKAALAIDNYIQGRELEDRTIKHDLTVAPQKEMIYRIHLEDSAPQDMPKQRYRDTFEKVELGFVNFGIGYMRKAYEGRKLMEVANEWLNLPQHRDRFVDMEWAAPMKGWRIPQNYLLGKNAANGLLLIGDAAAMNVPVSGEGVGPVMCSGAWASLTVMDALKKNDFTLEGGLASYPEYVNKYMVPEFREMRKLLDNIYDPVKCNAYIRMLREDPVANAKANEGFQGKLMFYAFPFINVKVD